MNTIYEYKTIATYDDGSYRDPIERLSSLV